MCFIFWFIVMWNKEKISENGDNLKCGVFGKLKGHIAKKLVRNFNCSNHNNFIKVNDLISYWTSHHSIHIHLIPRDISHVFEDPEEMKKCELLFIDALEKLKVILAKKKWKNRIDAISPIVRRKSVIWNLFEKYWFDVKSMTREKAFDDEELSYFVKNIFTDEKNKRHFTKIWRARITRETLFSDEWECMKNKYKQELLSK